MIRVLIADDQELIREGFKVLLETSTDIEVIGMADDGEEAVALATTLVPDVILMDIRMPKLDGIEATRQICKAQHAHVLIVTTFGFEEYVYNALRAGASGFVLKDIDPSDLIDAVRIVHSGEALLSPAITRILISEFAGKHEPKVNYFPEMELLTAREREILELIARGLSNGEISSSLFISQTTTKTHVAHIMNKLHIRDRAGLVIIAYESGLLTSA